MSTRYWFVPNPDYDGPPIELTAGRHAKDGRFIPKHVRLTPGISRLSRASRRRIPMIGDPSQGAREIYEMHIREKRKAAAPVDALIRRRVTLDPCKCGNRYALIGPGKGPNLGELLCQSCGKHRQWISRESFIAINKFVAEIVSQFGVEPAEIAFRRPVVAGGHEQVEASTSSLMADLEKRAPRNITGRASLFPRQNKAATDPDDGMPFDDPVQL